ncbi:hypothetical protein ACFWPK_18790 [Nocardia sp. NPDC058519]|uniref:hypothetical protein n=1 Tax=Nocardia sp. NPDC058519 TaxID=3346535 RepID=UPI00364EEA70
MFRAGFPTGEGGLDEIEALVERESGCSGMPCEHVERLDGGVEAVAKRGVAAHRRRVWHMPLTVIDKRYNPDLVAIEARKRGAWLVEPYVERFSRSYG